ncbi:MAG: 1-(5-phosphoribosyl)-5-[(5-phosphoribosylamino)methylideneamino]imidazole-4-carboxamide isomerase [Gammaproteobacteria bacterium]|nr:1-(5-phosphoribosyl)-5-[(5-phosphoribosylamino)methylideneamino]imidazole-4-carboxamide isomerase [Gammaproteobacteria bacterium]
MLLIPAIDLKDGRCVQLQQGVMASASVYSDDPPAMARHWCELGARRLHVVDLDGAFAGEPVNRRLVEGIVEAARDVPVQVGGGIRSIETAQGYIDAGASQVIAGTRATEDPDFLRALAAEFPGRAILGLDAKDGRAATRGWTTTSGVDVQAFAEGIRELDLFAIVYTDVARDGMLSGINAAATRRLAEVAAAPVIASGGVRNLDDLRTLKALDLDGKRLLGAISGSALYEGTLDFTRGQRLLDDG